MSFLASPGPTSPDPSVAPQPRACQFCRVRKIKCDKAQPVCSSCSTHGRTCVYSQERRRPRPSLAIISALQKEKQALENVLFRLKTGHPDHAAAVLQDVSIVDGAVRRSRSGSPLPTVPEPPPQEEPEPPGNDVAATLDGGFDPANHVSVDDQGQIGVFGLTSTLHHHDLDHVPVEEDGKIEDLRCQLVANAALQRQKEFQIRMLPDIDGVPVHIATHLLDLHWNRQHHTFLLTYRPALMRDLIHGGPYCSKLLLNAMFACASKYSDRVSLRDDPANPLTAGMRFFRRCDELLSEEPPFGRPSIPTVVAFLLLSSTFIARGDISKGWSYSGFAFRMIYDLGLHLDYRKPKTRPEDIEVRRRVFWGAFICDKLQSLYLGRPMAMHLEDSHCADEFLDTLEELDLWTPYIDPESPPPTVAYEPQPVYSVSTFQQLCRLSKLMTRIMNCFYSSNIPVSKAQYHLLALDASLLKWQSELPASLVPCPWVKDGGQNRCPVPPNIMNLHNTYHSLVILLNRPFVSHGHLRSSDRAASCWKKCTTAARNISNIVAAYRSSYTLRGAPYLTSYAAYVSCTIHVRNAALEKESQNKENLKLLMASLEALDELSVPNPGIARPANIIRQLMKKYGIEEQHGTWARSNIIYVY
ncbi:nitrogen assimilation transcription factor nirA [Thozetella sp. PMI_491]|nr:nitrogen assimilation transcription factor nirA [Thozetella sp. PMI_491]